jgi:hypothetical protein
MDIGRDHVIDHIIFAVCDASQSTAAFSVARRCGPRQGWRSEVSLTIDNNEFPHKVLRIRGTTRLDPIDGIVPEYATAAERYFGPEKGQAWVAQLRGMIPGMVRITVTPEWVGILDFQTRFPSALAG